MDRRLTTSAFPHVEIEHVAGKAKIIAWDKAEVHVSGELGDRAEKFSLEKQGDDIVIHVETNHRKINWQKKDYDDGNDLTIYVPAKASVAYEAVNASVNVSGLSNSIERELVNGDVKLQLGAIKSLSLTTVNGDVEAELTVTNCANVEASSVGGRISLAMQKGVSS